ncbi:MAG: hypothetical protein K6G75_10755 [Lachnospiraceae bacterium]|nr:hypothetical protein [Lachnospiraceae bacterium]
MINLLYLFSEIEDDFIIEADGYQVDVNKVKKKTHFWKKFSVAVCCIALIGVLIVVYANYTKSNVIKAKNLAADRFDDFAAEFDQVLYSNQDEVVFVDYRGIFVYSLSLEKLTAYANFRIYNMIGTQGDNYTRVIVSEDGQYIKFYDDNNYYLFDTQKNIVKKIDGYENYPDFEEYEIEILHPDDPNSFDSGHPTYIGTDGKRVSFVLFIDDYNSITYNNLFLMKETDNEIRYYQLFK